MTEKITIEQLTDVYQLTKGDYAAIIHGNDNLLKEIESLFGNAELPQKGQEHPREGTVNFHNEDNAIKAPPEPQQQVPVSKHGVTRTKVHALLDEGVSIADIAEKLGLTEAAIIYHEKSYVKKESVDEDPDADFRPMLNGVIDTSTGYDGSKLNEVDYD